MPRMTPRATQEVQAIKLRKDLLGEKGHWLIIHPDETLEVLTEAEVHNRYRASTTPTATTTPQPTQRYHKPRPIGPRPPSTPITIHGKSLSVSPQIAQLLSVLAATNRQTKTAEIAPYLPDIKNLAAALSYAAKLGFVTRHDTDQGVGTPKLWELSNNGREIVRQITKEG